MGNSAIAMSLSKYVAVSYIVQLFITILISYITIMLALKLSKGKYHELFTNLFGNSKGYLNMLIYTLIATAVTLFPLFLYIDFFLDFSNYFSNMPVGYIPDQYEMQDAIIGFLPSTSLMITSGIMMFVGFIISIKLFFAPYLIVDKNMSAIDAVKKSWEYTNGNFFRVLFFPLSFILWYLLIFVTCGLILIYIIPYTTLSYATFYNAILKENGDYIVPVDDRPVVDSNDPFETKKNIDPLDDYYE
jgi:uncharacterized membrane protein